MGYTNLGDDQRPAGKWWICEQCFDDFARELGWVVVQTDPDSGPYAAAEPSPRPTASDYRPGEWLEHPKW